MSYTSESKIPGTASETKLREIVELLGYRKVREDRSIPNMVGSYVWYDENDYRSWSGVELQIYRENGEFKVDTRSTISRSYWDIEQQRKTIKTIRDMFGGHFTTDAGRNRYWQPDKSPPSPLSSGCYLARWRFHNSLGKAHIYLMSRLRTH